MLQLQPASVPLRHAARAIMQQELTGKAAAAPAAVAAAGSNRSNGAGRTERWVLQQLQPGAPRAGLRCTTTGTSSSSSSNNNSSMSNKNSSSSSNSSISNKNSSSSKLLLCGWRGFFRGNLTNCLKVVPETAIKFYAYDICKHWLAKRKQQQQQQQQPQHQEPQLQLRDRFFCGAAAGLCAQLLIYPMELVNPKP